MQCFLIRNEVGKGVRLGSPLFDSDKPEDNGASSDPEVALTASVEDVIEGAVTVEGDDLSDVGDDETKTKDSETVYAHCFFHMTWSSTDY